MGVVKMKEPQLIVQDFTGAHNGDLGKTRARLIRGGSWKRQRIVVVIPAADMIPAKVALSHWNLAWPPNNGVCRILALGCEVGHAYSAAIEGVLAHPELSTWEHVLCIEADNCPPPDGVVRLIEDMEEYPQYSAIGGLYFTKGYGINGEGAGCAQIWGDPKDAIVNFRPQVPIPNIVQECVGCGMGFTLFRISMLKDQRLPRPLFRTKNGMNGEGVGTQDLSFFSEARKLGYRAAIDTRIAVGHYDFAGQFGPPDTMY